MIPNTIEALMIIMAVVAPGYLMRETISLARPKEEKTEYEQILDSLVLGFFNTILFFLITLALWKFGIVKGTNLLSYEKSLFFNIVTIITQNLWLSVIMFSIYIFLLPIVIGWIYGKIEIGRINPYPSAWDEFFIKTLKTHPVTLYIILKSGKTLCGIFGYQSRASTIQKYRDLYLEKEILLDENGKIVGIIKGESGLWVKSEEISFIKVLPYFTESEE